jgi:hypothetical protein
MSVHIRVMDNAQSVERSWNCCAAMCRERSVQERVQYAADEHH